MAHCYSEIGDHEKASQYIKKALSQHGDNRYFIDLWAQIATRQGDEVAARKALDRLEQLDKPMFYYHRRSRIDLAFFRMYEALASARQAFEAESSPPFEVMSQLALCEIETGNLQDAEQHLDILDSQYANSRRDIRTGLRCRLEIKKGRFAEALLLSERFEEKANPIHKHIRADALLGELRSSVLSDTVRQAYSLEVEQLKSEIVALDATRAAFKELDIIGTDI